MSGDDDLDLAHATAALARVRESERRLRAKLRASERLARIETIHRRSGVGFAELDEQLRYRHVNDVLAAINGLPVDAHIGRTIPEVIDSEEGRATERVARRVLESGQPSTDTEIRLATIGTAGAVRDWSVGFHPVRRDGESHASGVDIVVRDVTQRRQQERCHELERDVALCLAGASDSVDAVLEDVLALLVRSFDARAATLWRHDEPDGSPKPRARYDGARFGGADGNAGADHAELERFALEAFDADASPTLRWLDDFAGEVSPDGIGAHASTGVGSGTAFRVPIVDGDHRLGVLAVLSAERLGSNLPARTMLERLGRTLGAFVRRRDAELRLRQRERELDALTRDLPDALLRIDRHGRLVFANAAGSRLFCNGDADALVGRPAVDVGLPAELLAPLDLAFDGDAPSTSEFGLDGPEGRRWYRVRYVPEKEADGEVAGVLAIVGDVTDRRRIVSALAERERRLERALDEVDTLYRNLPVGLCVIDRQHRVVRLNKEMAQLNGDPVGRLEGQSLATLHPVFAEMIGVLLNGVLERGDRVLGYELDGALGASGERCHWIIDLLPLRDGAGGTRAVSCTVQDITSRKLTEQRLAARAAVAEVLGTVRDLDTEMPAVLAALERVFDPDISEYWVFDPDENRLTCDVFRCSERLGDEAATRRYFDDRALAPGEGLPGIVWSEGHARRLLDARHDELGACAPEARELGLRTAYGFPIVLDGRPIGVVTLFMGARLATGATLLEMLEQIGRDIGECERRLRDKRALEQARTAAERANRSKSDFLANVSHELRSPLTAILGYADILDTRLTDPDDRHSVRTVRNNGQHLLALLNDILDLAKIESDKFEPDLDPVALAGLVGEIRALMAVRAIERSLVLDVRADSLLPERIVTDELRLRQILINLIGNAIKFTDTGSVTLAMRFEKADVSRLVFDVIDTGIGMTSAQCEQLFEPFTQVDSSNTRRYGGTGLGLAISHRLAHLLEGGLAVRSTVGAGTTFTLTIPANVAPDTALVALDLDGTHGSEPAHDPAPYDLPPLPAHVLVADDRPDIRVMVSRFLESAGARVIAVTDGEAVIDTLADPAGSSSWPDAIVMDMQMPRLDGYEATRRIRAEGFDRPIVALTAAAMKGERERCLQVGCDDYLSKPIDGRLLIGTLATLIERHRHPEASASTEPTVTDATAREAKRLLSVLLVDDSRDAAMATARLLTRSGHDVRTTGNGRSALVITDEWRPDVVLLDIGLPDIDGLEVARRIRASHGDTPVLIALSGQAADGDEDSPFDHHLLKPARLRVLTELLDSIAERRSADPSSDDSP